MISHTQSKKSDEVEVQQRWCHSRLDYLQLDDRECEDDGSKKFRQRESDADGFLFVRDKVRVVFEWYPWDISSIKLETAIHYLIAGQGIAPEFLSHLAENDSDRVIGFVLEKVSGRFPTPEDLPACQAVLTKLHSNGFILDHSFTKYNFLITQSGSAIITDFSGGRFTNDIQEYVDEWAALEAELKRTSRLRDPTLRAGPEVLDKLMEINERDDGLIDSVAEEIYATGKCTVSAAKHQWMLYDHRIKMGCNVLPPSFPRE